VGNKKSSLPVVARLLYGQIQTGNNTGEKLGLIRKNWLCEARQPWRVRELNKPPVNKNNGIRQILSRPQPPSRSQDAQLSSSQPAHDGYKK